MFGFSDADCDEKNFKIFSEPLHGSNYFVVLPDLVSRGAGALLRSCSATLAHVIWTQHHHWNRSLSQFDDSRKQIGAMANRPVVSHAVFCIEFFRAG